MSAREIEEVLALASNVPRAKAIWREIQSLRRETAAVIRAAVKANGVGDFQAQLDDLGMRGNALRYELLGLYGLTSTPPGEVAS